MRDQLHPLIRPGPHRRLWNGMVGFEPKRGCFARSVTVPQARIHPFQRFTSTGWIPACAGCVGGIECPNPSIAGDIAARQGVVDRPDQFIDGDGPTEVDRTVLGFFIDLFRKLGTTSQSKVDRLHELIDGDHPVRAFIKHDAPVQGCTIERNANAADQFVDGHFSVAAAVAGAQRRNERYPCSERMICRRRAPQSTLYVDESASGRSVINIDSNVAEQLIVDLDDSTRGQRKCLG